MRANTACLLLAGVLVLVAAPALADPPAPAWFVPPPPKAGIGATVDTRSYGSFEEITVTAPRRRAAIQRDPRGEETHDFQPAHSDAASPDPRPTTASGYCSSAYQTVAGQAATGADMVGMGSGHCD
jgi:hypothetical protein